MSPSTMLRVLAFALLISLAVNVMLAGTLVTGWAAGSSHARDHAHAAKSSRWPDVRGLRHRLGADDAAALERLLDAHRGELRAHRRAIGEARRAVADALVAEPFDAAALDAAFAALRTRESALAGDLHALLGEFALTGPSARSAVAEATPSERRGRRDRQER